MRLSSYLACLVPVAALLSAAAPIEAVREGLDESTWTVTDKGLWLVEHYSPYCSHCRAFAPKWKELVDLYSTTGSRHDFNFAQVDCVANGDLCHQHGVKYYPSIFLYEDGKFKEEYVDKRSVEQLTKYVEANWRETKIQPGKHDGPRDGEAEESQTQTRLRPVKGAEKARLPKLHLTEETEVPSADLETDGPEPYRGLLADASSKVDAFLDLDLTEKATGSVIVVPLIQTFPPAPMSSSTSARSESQPPTPKFLAQQPESKRSAGAEGSTMTYEWEKSRGKPDGTVKQLEKADAERIRDPDAGPSFVKYFAPWCGHCKKLAPHWEALASSLQHRVRVYEMDCDSGENKGVCRREGVQAYPTLIFYNRGAVVEYHGRREETAMQAWALKTIDSTTIKPVTNKAELSRAIEQDPVVVLLLYSETNDKDDIALAREAAKSQMGSTPFYASTSAELLSLFARPSTSAPTFLIFKSSSLEPVSLFSLPSKPLRKRKRVEQTQRWLRGAKMPVLSELDGASYPHLFPEDSDPSDPYVALGFFSKKGLQGEFDQTVEKFRSLAQRWSENEKTAAQGQRTVTWAWVDGDRWAPWSRSTYDVKMGALAEPVILVSDPHNRVYWKSDLAGAPLHADNTAVFDLIRKGIVTGSVPGVSSDGFVGRLSQTVVRSSSASFATAMAHPFLTFFLVVFSWVGLALLLQKIFASPVTSGPSGGSAYKSDDVVKKD